MPRGDEFRRATKEEDRFDAIFRENYKALFLYASKFVHDRDVVSDLVHDVFEKIWAKMNRIDEIRNLKSFLFSSIRNECINYIRKQKVREEYLNQEVYNAERELEYYSVHNSIIEDNRIDRLHSLINSLPDIYREVFILSRFDNLSNNEIADKLGIPLRTVETRLYRGIKRIREGFMKEV